MDQTAVQVGCFTVYQAADHHDWRCVRADSRVFFNREDVQAYFEPEPAHVYLLAESAADLGIQVEQAALVARL